jgi:hypothetical protein
LGRFEFHGTIFRLKKSRTHKKELEASPIQAPVFSPSQGR